MQIPWCQVLLWKNLWRTLRSESCVQSAGWNPTHSLATTLISCSTATHHSRNKLRGPTRAFRRYSLVSQRKHWSQAYWVLCSESPDFERHRRRPLLFWSPNRITRGFVSAQFSEGDLCTLPQVGNESFQRGSGEANMSHEEMAIILYPQHVGISSSLSEINLRIKYTVHQINIRTLKVTRWKSTPVSSATRNTYTWTLFGVGMRFSLSWKWLVDFRENGEFWETVNPPHKLVHPPNCVFLWISISGELLGELFIA